VARLKPYRYWAKGDLLEHLYHIARETECDTWVFHLIDEAVNDYMWNPTQDFDGCTIVQDMTHPSLPCFIHDYLWMTGRGGKVADSIFYDLMIQCGVSKNRASRRWVAVRVGWGLWYKWRNYAIRNVHIFTHGMNLYLKSKK